MVIYFHRNQKAGFSINKVTQTVIKGFQDKKEYYVPYIGATLKVVLKNCVYIYKRREKKYVNHITGDISYGIIALIGCKSVLTVHDTVSLDFNNYSWLKRKYIELLWYVIPLALATRVVCISESTKKSLSRYTRRRDIKVIYNAVDSSFVRAPKNSVNLLNVNILHIGTSANKNLDRLIVALSGISCSLTIIGRLSKRNIQLLKQNNIKYINKNNLTDDEIYREYVNSDIVSFVSLFEGFGMIVVEANQVGRPVICSNIPPLKEVAGDSAFFVDPYDVDSIRNGFVTLINNDELQKELVQKGYDNVNRFEKDKIIQEWLSFYNELNYANSSSNKRNC